MKRFLLFIIILFAMSACEEQALPPASSGTPMFFAIGTMDGEAFQWNAGEEGFYMYTEYQNSSEAVNEYAGYIAKENCESNCRPKLRFVFFDESEESEKLDEVLIARKSDYSEPEMQDAYELSFSPEVWTANPQAASLTYEWDFGDETKATGATPKHYFPVNDDGFSVCLDVLNSTDNSRSSICRDVKWEDPCFKDFEVVSQIGYYNVQVLDPEQNDQYDWAFSSGRFANGSVIDCEYGERASERICLTTTNTSDGCVSTICKNVVIDSSRAKSAVNFDFDMRLTQIPTEKTIESKRVRIEYTDPSGKLYTSDQELQPADSYFEIVNVEDFDPNKNGSLTKKMELLFNCKLYNGTSSISLNDFHANIAVAIP